MNYLYGFNPPVGTVLWGINYISDSLPEDYKEYWAWDNPLHLELATGYGPIAFPITLTRILTADQDRVEIPNAFVPPITLTQEGSYNVDLSTGTVSIIGGVEPIPSAFPWKWVILAGALILVAAVAKKTKTIINER